MQFVDAHIHFWDPKLLRYDWLEGVGPINRPFLPEDLWAQTGRFQLEKIIFVQAGAHPDDALAEVEWVTKLAGAEPRIAAIVADAPMENGTAVGSHLAQLAEWPLVKGVRRLIQGAPAGFANSSKFIDAVKLLPEYGFSFDLCIFHPQMLETIQLVKACPEVQFVLDHIGKPDIKGGQLEPWRAEIAQLAKLGNVSCKLSGLITEANYEAWQPAELQPYVDHVIDCFGAERLMFGGDWPVSLLATESWEGWLATALGSAKELTPTEQQAVFHDNALAFYRVE